MTVFSAEVWRCDALAVIRMDPATLSILGTVATIGGGVVGAIGAISNANAQAGADRYNAQVAQQNAIAAQQQAEQNAIIQQQTAAKQIGAQIAGYGGSGVVSGEGSALDVLSNSVSSAELDRQTILYKGKLQSLGYQDESQLDEARAGNAQTQGFESAFGTILGTAGKIATRLPFGSSDNLSGSSASSSSGDFG